MWRQKPPASIGNNFKIPFAYHSVFSIPVQEGDALYEVLLVRLGGAVHPLGQGGPGGPDSCWGAENLQIHFMQGEPCPWGTPRLIACSRDTPQTWQAAEAVVKGRIGLCVFYIYSTRSWDNVTI